MSKDLRGEILTNVHHEIIAIIVSASTRHQGAIILISITVIKEPDLAGIIQEIIGDTR